MESQEKRFSVMCRTKLSACRKSVCEKCLSSGKLSMRSLFERLGSVDRERVEHHVTAKLKTCSRCGLGGFTSWRADARNVTLKLIIIRGDNP